MTQALKELLTEQGIALEPDKPPGKTVSTLIQRGWSLLFGRKGTYLYPARVERLGGLMVMPFEGLVAPDHVNRIGINTSSTTAEFYFTTAAPRISEVAKGEGLTATPFTSSSHMALDILDGTIAAGTIVAYMPTGNHKIWVLTTSQYLSVQWLESGAVDAEVDVRTWDL